MAAAPYPTPITTTTPLIPHKILLSQSTSCPKLEVGSSYFGRKLHRTNFWMAKPPILRRSGPAMAALGGLLGGLFKGTDTGEGTRQRYSENVALINRLEPEISGMQDSELRERTMALKERARNNEPLDSLLPMDQLVGEGLASVPFQGPRDVREYVTRFMEWLSTAPHMMAVDEYNARLFIGGLQPEVRRVFAEEDADAYLTMEGLGELSIGVADEHAAREEFRLMSRERKRKRREMVDVRMVCPYCQGEDHEAGFLCPWKYACRFCTRAGHDKEDCPTLLARRDN